MENLQCILFSATIPHSNLLLHFLFFTITFHPTQEYSVISLLYFLLPYFHPHFFSFLFSCSPYLRNLALAT